MNPFSLCARDSLYTVFKYLTVADVKKLAAVSSETALVTLDCITHIYHAHHVSVPWHLAFPLYLRAEHAASLHALDVVRRLPFVSYLSRACRGCGKRTQRTVHDTLLCAACTRNDRLLHAWMVPARVAQKMGAHHIRVHHGPRCALVFAIDITRATRKGRARIKMVARSLRT